MIKKIHSKIVEITGIGLHKYDYLRAAAKFAQKYFKNQQVIYAKIGVWKGVSIY